MQLLVSPLQALVTQLFTNIHFSKRLININGPHEKSRTTPELLCISSQRTNWSQPHIVFYQLETAQNTIREEGDIAVPLTTI